MDRGRDQLGSWFRRNVLEFAIVTDTEKAENVKWDRDNAIFADVLLRADEADEEDAAQDNYVTDAREQPSSYQNALGIPSDLQQSQPTSRTHSQSRNPKCSKLFACHRAMLIRSEFFLKMFSSSFREAQHTPHLQIIPIACSPTVLEIVLTFLYLGPAFP
jgi:ankyrin repeat and BTB/POZ domain-containing protein 1